MDFIIFEFTVALACIFLYLYTRDLGMIYLGIVAGFLFILAGLPIVATENLEFHTCYEHAVNSTIISVDTGPPNNQTTTTSTFAELDEHCFKHTYDLPWKLKEAFGAFFILIGLGTILAVSHNQKKSGDGE